MRQNSSVNRYQRLVNANMADLRETGQQVTLTRPKTITLPAKTQSLICYAYPVSAYQASTLNLEGQMNAGESDPHIFQFPQGSDIAPNDIVQNFDGWQWRLLAPFNTPVGGIKMLAQTVGVRQKKV